MFSDYIVDIFDASIKSGKPVAIIEGEFYQSIWNGRAIAEYLEGPNYKEIKSIAMQMVPDNVQDEFMKFKKKVHMYYLELVKLYRLCQYDAMKELVK